ncbi:MAG: hypothetical protein R3B54_16150 [Bdellovibrionota bacterium]
MKTLIRLSLVFFVACVNPNSSALESTMAFLKSGQLFIISASRARAVKTSVSDFQVARGTVAFTSGGALYLVTDLNTGALSSSRTG